MQQGLGNVFDDLMQQGLGTLIARALCSVSFWLQAHNPRALHAWRSCWGCERGQHEVSFAYLEPFTSTTSCTESGYKQQGTRGSPEARREMRRKYQGHSGAGSSPAGPATMQRSTPPTFFRLRPRPDTARGAAGSRQGPRAVRKRPMRLISARLHVRSQEVVRGEV
jgi:hypothetical protein